MLSPHPMALKSKLLIQQPGLPLCSCPALPCSLARSLSITRLHARGYCLFLEEPRLLLLQGLCAHSPSLSHPLPLLSTAGSFSSFHFCQNITSSMKPSLTTLVKAAAHTSVAF